MFNLYIVTFLFYEPQFLEAVGTNTNEKGLKIEKKVKKKREGITFSLSKYTVVDVF